jgi:hypothetical protein
MITRHLGDASIETSKDALDEVLAVLKDPEMNDQKRRAMIDGLLGIDKLKEDEFSSLLALG